MYYSKLRKFAWAFIALIFTAGSVFSQGWRNGNQINRTQNSTCLETISGITEQQKSKIVELENKHQQEMNELRLKQRSTYDIAEKNKLHADMDTKVSDHRNAVKALLNEDQQKQYDQLHAPGNRRFAGRQQFARRGNGASFNRGCGYGYRANNQNFNRGRRNAGNVAPCGRNVQQGRNRQQFSGAAAGRCGNGRFAGRGYGRGFRFQNDSTNNVQINN